MSLHLILIARAQDHVWTRTVFPFPRHTSPIPDAQAQSYPPRSGASVTGTMSREAHTHTHTHTHRVDTSTRAGGASPCSSPGFLLLSTQPHMANQQVLVHWHRASLRGSLGLVLVESSMRFFIIWNSTERSCRQSLITKITKITKM